MDNDSEVGSWGDSRTEVAAWNRIVQTRRPTDMPGGLLVTLCSGCSYPAAGSRGVSRQLLFLERVDEPR